MNEDGQYLRRELTLQINDAAHTAIAVSAPMPESFYTFRPTWFRRKIRSPTYFVIEFTAMVGTIRHRVATIY
jgi:hypothetical protein